MPSAAMVSVARDCCRVGSLDTLFFPGPPGRGLCCRAAQNAIQWRFGLQRLRTHNRSQSWPRLGSQLSTKMDTDSAPFFVPNYQIGVTSSCADQRVSKLLSHLPETGNGTHSQI